MLMVVAVDNGALLQFGCDWKTAAATAVAARHYQLRLPPPPPSASSWHNAVQSLVHKYEEVGVSDDFSNDNLLIFGQAEFYIHLTTKSR